LSEDQIETYKAALGSGEQAELLKGLFDVSQEELRVLANIQQGGGVVTFRVSVPKELGNIVVLDASHPIRKLAQLGWRRLNLAVSLNAPNDEIRSRIMPHNRREPLAELRDALLAYPLRNCQFFMMEYVLIPGVNNAREHAFEVAEYLRPLKSMLNVIPYNPRRDSPWPAPTEADVTQFLAWLKEAGQGCKRRVTKGREQMAACGQLGNRALARKPRGNVRT